MHRHKVQESILSRSQPARSHSRPPLLSVLHFTFTAHSAIPGLPLLSVLTVTFTVHPAWLY